MASHLSLIGWILRQTESLEAPRAERSKGFTAIVAKVLYEMPTRKRFKGDVTIRVSGAKHKCACRLLASRCLGDRHSDGGLLPLLMIGVDRVLK